MIFILLPFPPYTVIGPHFSVLLVFVLHLVDFLLPLSTTDPAFLFPASHRTATMSPVHLSSQTHRIATIPAQPEDLSCSPKFLSSTSSGSNN